MSNTHALFYLFLPMEQILRCRRALIRHLIHRAAHEAHRGGPFERARPQIGVTELNDSHSVLCRHPLVGPSASHGQTQEHGSHVAQ